MARLPKVNGDDGNWGDILNDYLSQSHTPNGALAANTVGAPQLKQNSVTSAAIAPGAVTPAAITDGTIPAAKLSDLDQAVAAALPDNITTVVATEVATQVDPKVTAAQTAKTDAETAATDAATARIAAEAARDTALAVPTTSDGITAGLIAKPDSATAAALSAAIGQQVAPKLDKTEAATTYALKSEAGGGPVMPPLANISKASTGPFRVLHVGTSIADAADSAGKMLGEQLKARYGDSGLVQFSMGNLGGTTTNVWQGWNKQTAGTHMLTRLRGSTTSTDLTFKGYFDTTVLEWSREMDTVPVEILIDGASKGFVGTAGSQLYGQVATFAVPLGFHVLTIKAPSSAAGYAYLEWLELQNSARRGVEIRSASLGGSSIRDMTQVHAAGTNQVAPIPIQGNNGLDVFFNRPDFDLIVVQDVVNDAGAGIAWAQGGYQTSMNYAVEATRQRGVPVISIIEMGGHYSILNDNGNATNYTAFNTIREYQLRLRSNNHWTIIDWHGATILPDLNAYMLRYYGATGLNVSAGTFTGDFTHPTIVGHQVAQAMVTAATGIPTPAKSSVLGSSMDRIWSLPNGVGLSQAATTDATVKQYPAPAGAAFQAIGQGLSSAFQGRTIPYYRDTAAINRADQAGIKADIAASITSTEYGQYKDYTLKSIGLGTFANWAGGEKVMYTIKGTGTISLRVDSPARFFVDGAEMTDATQSSLFYVTTGTKPVVVAFVVGSTANNGNTYISGRIYEVAVTKSTVPLLTT